MRCFFSIILFITFGASLLSFSPFLIDIRNHYLKKDLSEQDKEKGRKLLLQMENACGGKEAWIAHEQASFIQKSDWYGRLRLSHWDTLPQMYRLTCELGKNEGELTYINGPNKRKAWGIENGKCYTYSIFGDQAFTENETISHKIEFKSYWFQFPFRINEATIVSYAGEANIEGADYELVYATWGSEAANKEFDQFVIYINKKTHLIEWLHFTVRSVSNAISFTAKFDGFKAFDGITLPTSQYITKGKPGGKDGMKFHENYYSSITFGKN